MYRSSRNWWKVALVVLAILAVLVAWIAGDVIPNKVAVDHVSGHIVNSYVKTENDSGVYYIVLQKDDGATEVFQDRDNIWQGKWNSSDVFAQLGDIQKKNQHVTLKVTGWRIQFLSWYRDIISVEHVDNQ